MNTIRRQPSASRGYNSNYISQNNKSQPIDTKNTISPQTTPKDSKPRQAKHETSYAKYDKDASQASMGKNLKPKAHLSPREQQNKEVQKIADKTIATLGALNTLPNSASGTSKIINILVKSGVISKDIGKTVRKLLTHLRGKSPSEITQAIKSEIGALEKSGMGKVNMAFSLVIGTLDLCNQIKKGDIKGALKSVVNTAAGFAFAAPNLLLNAAQGLLREFVPGYKGSVMDKILGSLDLLEWVQTGVDAGVETMYQIMVLCKTGNFDTKSLDRLVSQMKKCGAQYVVALGEFIGEKSFDILQGAKKEFMDVWLTLNDPNARFTPSQSGKIAATMGQIAHKMNSPHPHIRKQATKMAKSMLTKLVAQAKKDPVAKKALSKWYGMVQSTGSQNYGVYRQLFQQSPKLMQNIHSQWRESSNFVLRFFLDKKIPQF